jgi:hypothetical protein
MEATQSIFEPLLARVEAYGKSSFDLIKLKSIDKTSNVLSTVISRLLLVIVGTVFFIILNIGIALWIGDVLDKSYYGFFIVAGFYGIVSIILYLAHASIKAGVGNSIVKQFFNK